MSCAVLIYVAFPILLSQLCLDLPGQLSTNNQGVSAGSRQLVKCVKTLARPRADRSDIQVRMEDEMRRHQAEMNLLFEEVRHVSYAAVGWQYVT